MNQPDDVLVGKTIQAVRVSDNGGYIGFRTTDGNVVFEAYGDCCSRSWVERVSNVEALLGERIVAVKTLELPTPDPQPAKYDSLAVYGYALQTAKGECEVEFRNDSNGYYGGSLEECTAAMPSVKVETEWVCNDAERKGPWD